MNPHSVRGSVSSAPLVGLALVAAVSLGLEPQPFGIVTIDSAFELDGSGANVDSPAFWEAPQPEETLLFVTSKNSQLVQIWRHPFLGQELPPLRFPSGVMNGVAVDQDRDELYVTDSQAKEVIVFSLPGLQELRRFGKGVLGSGETNLDLLTRPDGEIWAYVTDDHTVHAFNGLTGVHITAWNPPVTSLETVLADDFHQLVHVPDEQGGVGEGIHVFSPMGDPVLREGTNRYGQGHFDSDEEGIAVYRCSDGTEDTGAGWVVVSDQVGALTQFEFFDRETWRFLGTLQINGVGNTDGIAISQRPLPDFPLGVLAAVDDDSRTAIVGWDKVLEATGLECPTPPSPGFVLSVNRTGAGRVQSSPEGIDCGESCSHRFSPGDQVTLSATPAPGFLFGGWDGDPDCADGLLLMDADKSCTANLEPDGTTLFTLTVAVEGSGNGRVTGPGIDCEPDCSEPYVVGTAVTLTAASEEGSVFTGWAGGCSADGAVTMNGDRTCTARFEPRPVRLELAIDDSDGDGRSNDDVEESASGSITLASGDLDVENGGASGLRFTGVMIPQGSRIVSARLLLTSDENRTGQLEVLVYGEATDDAPPFTRTRRNVTDPTRRPPTGQQVSWAITEPWLRATSTSPATVHSTPDLAAIVQEIADRPGWAEGHAMVFVLRHRSGTRRVAETVEGDGEPAHLVVEFILPAGSVQRQRHAQRLIEGSDSRRREAGHVVGQRRLRQADERVTVDARVVLEPVFGADALLLSGWA